MATIVDLAAERAKRHPLAEAMARLDLAIDRLDPLVLSGRRQLGPLVEAELFVIAAAVRTGRAAEAAERAERLADRLEHPAALGS